MVAGREGSGGVKGARVVVGVARRSRGPLSANQRALCFGTGGEMTDFCSTGRIQSLCLYVTPWLMVLYVPDRIPSLNREQLSQAPETIRPDLMRVIARKSPHVPEAPHHTV